MVGRICRILDGKHLIIIIETATLSLREREGLSGCCEHPLLHSSLPLLCSRHPPTTLLSGEIRRRRAVARCELLLLIIDSPFPLSNATLGWERNGKQEEGKRLL